MRLNTTRRNSERGLAFVVFAPVRAPDSNLQNPIPVLEKMTLSKSDRRLSHWTNERAQVQTGTLNWMDKDRRKGTTSVTPISP